MIAGLDGSSPAQGLSGVGYYTSRLLSAGYQRIAFHSLTDRDTGDEPLP